MTLRIAMVGACPYPVPQGSQVFLRDSALALRRLGHDVCLVTYGHGLGEDPSGLAVYRVPRLPFDHRTAAGPSAMKPLLDAILSRTLRRVVRDRGIDAVCVHNYEALAAALLARVRPIVYFAHNALSDELPHYFRGAAWAGWIGARLDGFLPRRADAIIAPHPRLAACLRARGCRRVTVIPPPMDATAFPEPVVQETIPPVLYTGNLDAYQNLGLLEEAMARLRRRLPDARLVVATARRETLPGTEHLHTPGFPALLATLAQDAVVAAPRVSWSGYPIKLLNAMAAAKAVVACESAAHPLAHEATGLVVPDNDAEAFAGALHCLLTNPALRKRLGHAAREQVIRAHAPEIIGRAAEKEIEAATRRVRGG